MRDIKCRLDIDSVRETRDRDSSLNQYGGIIYFDVDGEYFFPEKNAVADPFYVLGWMLRELRLSYSGKSKERHIYFNTLAGQYIYITLNGDVLTLRFTYLKKNGPFLRMASGVKRDEIIERSFDCEFAGLYLDVYDSARQLYDKFKNTVPRGGCVDDLGIELRKAERLANKLRK